MDPLKDGARLLSKGMRGGHGLLTFLGALLVARGVIRWLDGPSEELVYSKRLRPGDRLEVAVTRTDDYER